MMLKGIMHAHFAQSLFFNPALHFRSPSALRTGGASRNRDCFFGPFCPFSQFFVFFFLFCPFSHFFLHLSFLYTCTIVWEIFWEIIFSNLLSWWIIWRFFVTNCFWQTFLTKFFLKNFFEEFFDEFLTIFW